MRDRVGSVAFTVVFAVLIHAAVGLVSSDVWAFNEAPSLAQLVKDGKLPPVDKRLPESPVVVKPIDQPGEYGGTWRRAYTGLSDLVGARRILYDPLVRWSPDYKVVPNLAHKWEIDKEGRNFTFYLVKGVRWSDGAPFTADDIVFYVEDVLCHEELSGAIPRWLSPDGSPPKVIKVDDYTIRFEFAVPHGLFLQQLATPEGMALVTKPKHYLKQFHKRYADPEKLKALLEQKNVSSWTKLFQDVSNLRHSLFISPEMPSICAWITKVPAPGKRFIMERNPYYWKVDTAGNQLPYIDVIVHDLQAESQTILLKAMAGEIDFQGRGVGGMQNSVLLLSTLSQGNFKLIPKTSTASVGLLIAPNLNHQDPVMRQVLSDPRFRKALSHGVNRNEVNKIVYRSMGTPRQAAPLKDCPYYDESYEKAYLEYNPAKAESLLDEMGLKKGSDSMRLRPDGRPLLIALDVNVAIQSWVDTAEIIASNLNAIGIKTEVKSEAMELFRQRTQTGAHDIALWPGDAGMECLLDPRWYFPFSSESLHAPLYAKWYQTRGKSGDEPPAVIKDLMQIYDQILETVDEGKQRELFAKIITANRENLWVIGLVHDPPDYYVATPNMYNVPKKDFQSWTYPNPGPVHPEQFFFGKK